MYNSGRRGKRTPDGYGVISINDKFHQTSYPIPIIDSWSITDGSYNPIDDTALDTAGGQTIVLYGSGFASGATVNINGSNIGIVTVLDSNRITFTSPALSAASYTIYVSNTDGATAIYVPGLVYSGLPTWSSPASGSIGTNYETKNVSTLSYTTFTATGDATITYSVISGNLPDGVTLSSSGELSGTLPATASPTTYSFTIRASDGQNQDSDRAFSLTINPDAVTWVAPTLNGSLSVYETQSFSTPLSATSAAGYGVMYSADTLPTGITLNPSTGELDGYANTVGNTNAQLTATANTTGRYTTSNVTFTVNQDVVTWSSPANNTEYTLGQGTAIDNVTLSATSAAGYGVQYTANALPTGVTLSGDTISGTPTESEIVYTELTATSNTTNRTATRFISWTVSVAGDQYFKYNSLLLSANNSIQTPSFVYDNSINNSQLSVFGDTRATNFNPYQHGYYSNYFDGTGDYLSVPYNSNLYFGSGDFTVEFWYNSTINFNTGYGPCIGFGYKNTPTGGWVIYRNTVVNTDRISVRVAGQGGAGFVDFPTGSTVETNKWNHWALVRSGTSLKWYKNGVLDASTTNSVNITDTDTTTLGYVGYAQQWSYAAQGYLSNVRVVKGTALYTSNFTPSTTPLTPVANTVLLTSQSNRLIDNSPINHTITKNGDTTVSSAHPFSTVYQAGTQYYSTKFDGTGDYLSIANNTAFTLGTNDHTIEFWIYLNGAQGPYATAWKYSSGSTQQATNDYYFYAGSAGGASFGLLLGGGGSWAVNISNNASYTAGLNTWTHVAITRSSNTFRLFVNGTQVGSSVTYSGSIPAQSGAMLLGQDGSSNFTTGIISNFRIINGTALYTSNFTPSTTPLTAVSGTVLLTCQDSTLKDNSTNNFTITGSGDAKPVAVSPFTPSSYTNTEITTYGSGYFDGTGDYLTVADSSMLNLGSNNFTIELWYYPTSTPGSNNLSLLSKRASNAVFGGFWLSFNSNLTPIFSISNAAANAWISITSSISCGLNSWNRITATRVGANMYLYVNGIYAGTNATAGVEIPTNTASVAIGASSATGSEVISGCYISDLRIIKGTALYTSNFVPQFTSPLSNVTNTQLLTLQTNGSSNNSTFVDKSRFDNKLTRFGNATNGTFSPYGDNWSVYFPGTSGSYLVTPTALKTAMGNGFSGNIISMEMFVFPTNLNNGSYVNSFVGAYQAVSANGRWMFYHNRSSASNTTLGFAYTTGTGSQANLDTTNAVLNSNQWNHIAVTIDATTNTNATIKIFANGSLVQTWTGQNLSTQTAYYDSPTIGGPNSGYVDQFAGYISNFRILKGAFAYTGNYTVPTSPLQSITGTVFNGLQSNRFVDFSVNNYAITPTGSPTVQKFSPFGTLVVPKYYSTFFNGTTDYLTAPAPVTTYQAFDWSGTSWTVEGWYNFNSVSGNKGLFTYPDLLQGWYDGTNLKFEYRHATGPAWATNYTAYAIQPNTWYHIALVLNSGSMRCYVNGTAIGTATTGIGTGSRGSTTGFGEKFAIGANDVYTFGSIDSYFSGYISNFRVSKIAVYTGNFTVPTAPLEITQSSNTNISALSTGQVTLLTCKDISLKDNTSNNWTISSNTFTAIPAPLSPFTPTTTTVNYSPQVFGGSMYFDGTGDYLTAPNTNSFDLSRGAWTIECWFYQHTAKQVQLFSVGAARWRLDVGTNGSAGFLFNTSSVTSYPSGSFPPGQWNHIAATFTNDGTISQQKSYANGKLIATGQYGPSADTTSVFYVGRNVDAGSGWDFNGYMTDVLITKGESLYGQSSFYPRTSPAQVTANTAFLLNGTTAGVVDATRTTDLETVADTKVTKFSPYNGSYYSNYFNGSSSYLTTPNSSTDYTFGTSDFTIEGWYYVQSTLSGTQYTLIERRTTGFAAGDWTIFLTNATIQVYAYDKDSAGASPIISGNIPVTPYTWHHIALVRYGNTLYLYQDGALAGSIAFNVTVANNSQGITIGTDNGGGAQSRFFWPGYLSNIRIVKGTAIYQTSFVGSVPTTPLTAVSGTVLLTGQSNKFVDNSTVGATITVGSSTKVQTQNPFQVNTGQSYYFDGTGDYLSVTNNLINFAFGSSDFTVELWVCQTSLAAAALVDFRGAISNVAPSLELNSSGKLVIYKEGSGTLLTSTNGITAGSWNHLVYTRVSGVLKVFVNGVLDPTTANDTTNWAMPSGKFTIGGNKDAGGLLNGYISDLRITKGVARTITVPSTPLILK